MNWIFFIKNPEFSSLIQTYPATISYMCIDQVMQTIHGIPLGHCWQLPSKMHHTEQYRRSHLPCVLPACLFAETIRTRVIRSTASKLLELNQQEFVSRSTNLSLF